nr:transposase [Psychroflexus torquis]
MVARVFKFGTASQVCSYISIKPTARKSESSVRVRARISMVVNKKLRHMLFLYSLRACKHNKAYREIIRI